MKTIKKRFHVAWGRLLARVLAVFGVTSMAFVFQACYAPYYANDYDYRCINGEVLSSQTHMPIKGVKVTATGHSECVETDSVGRFHLHLVGASAYTLRFADQSDSIGAYLPKDTVVYDVNYEGEKITIYLDKL